MMFLDTTNQYCDEQGIIVPWQFRDLFQKPWDEVAEVCKYRKLVHSKTEYATRKRLSYIISKSAHLLGGSNKTSKDLLTVRFLSQWIVCCDYLKENHADDAEGLEVLGKRMTITMGPFQFLSPDISNVIHLAGLQAGCDTALQELEDDRKRRQAKAAAMRKLTAAWQDVERKIGYLLKDADSIKMLEPSVTKALASIEDEIEFLAESRSDNY